MNNVLSRVSRLGWLYTCLLVLASFTGVAAQAQEVIVLGSTEAVVEWMNAENFWGEENRGEHLQVPRAMITGITPTWAETSAKMPVAQKKEIFYRFMLPLVIHANDMVLDSRAKLQAMDARLAMGESLRPDEIEWLGEAAYLLRIVNQGDQAKKSATELRQIISEALYKLDIIPVGLVLGQAAYESGYGTSRFAAEGNALFGQWVYGGQGMVPDQQRKNLGDHRIASYEWPFDSVRSYYINLSSHPTYESFRKLRAEARAAGKPLSSIELAQGLTSYSERGQEYVDTLRSIIRVNKLDNADGAVFRDEPMRFIVGADGDAAAVELEQEIEQLRASGQLDTIIERMRLE